MSTKRVDYSRKTGHAQNRASATRFYKASDLAMLLATYAGSPEMTKNAQQDIARELKAPKHAQESGNVTKICRYFGICRQTFYAWNKAFAGQGEKGLIDSRP